MGKFSNAALKNPVTKKPWHFDPEKGTNPEVLHHFARFGMLGFKELNLLLPHHDRHIYRTIQLAKADNARFIKLSDWQERHKSQLWSADLFYQLTPAGQLINTKHAVPDYEPPAGNDFDHRAMSVRWAVSLYAGATADPHTRQIDWPEIKDRLPRNASPSVDLGDKRISTDWTPKGFQRGDYFKFTRGPEIDCSTESHPVIKKKMVFHARASEQGLHETQLGLPNDFIPFVTISERRKQGMMQDLAELINAGDVKKRTASLFGFAVFPYYGSKEPLDTRAYTMPYERVGHPDFYFNA